MIQTERPEEATVEKGECAQAERDGHEIVGLCEGRL